MGSNGFFYCLHLDFIFPNFLLNVCRGVCKSQWWFKVFPNKLSCWRINILKPPSPKAFDDWNQKISYYLKQKTSSSVIKQIVRLRFLIWNLKLKKVYFLMPILFSPHFGPYKLYVKYQGNNLDRVVSEN